MLIFEYQCEECLSVFENSGSSDVTCLICGSKKAKRVDEMIFSPNKNFCNNVRLKKKEDIRSKLIDLFGENEMKCYHKCK